ncbi:hypothetical protein [Nesterenkonia pannonica]|uniref:hypothetical protein n=1 Tax=Nesterenkonia pannonica TaxID=1548602 RepID=UPI00216483AD|nr:hypothetical protein [Nesterenkonia pannonica]
MDGDGWDVGVSGIKAATAELSGILQLSLKQFTKVILLPQETSLTFCTPRAPISRRSSNSSSTPSGSDAWRSGSTTRPRRPGPAANVSKPRSSSSPPACAATPPHF